MRVVFIVERLSIVLFLLFGFWVSGGSIVYGYVLNWFGYGCRFLSV